MDSFKLISVESRKGGVGKTTAALNLGYLLRDNYHVLILDIDITGTSISAIQNSRFWREDAYLLKDSRGESINLLQYFTERYLRGNDIADFCVNEEKGKILVKDNTINVIASELYGEDANLLYDPSLLLENVHIYWLTEMLLSISKKFSSCFSDKESVIILDNSPGFVGIGKAVHDILLSFGPEVGKFLTVSSLDEQDLESSLKAIYSIHSDYQKKLESILNPSASSADMGFYTKVKLSGDTEYIYYKEAKKEASLSSYQGIVINKVAKEIIDGYSSYEYQSILSTQIAQVYKELTEDGATSRMVPFDNVLLTQFYGYLVQKQVPRSTSLQALTNRILTIERQLDRIESLPGDMIPLDLMRLCNGLDRSIDSLKGALIASGYEVMASKFNIDWSPISPLRKLLSVLKRVGFALDAKELYFPKKSRMEREMLWFRDVPSAIHLLSRQGAEFVWFGGAVASVACELSFCYYDTRLWDQPKPSTKNHIKMLKMINSVGEIDNSLAAWMKAIGEVYSKSKHDYLASFILSESVSHYDKYLKRIIGDEEFVRSFKISISHLMDVVADIRLLTSVMRAVTINNDGGYSKDVDFVSFLNRKIVSKELDYEKAKSLMYTDLRDSDYMSSYRAVLARVINQWGL